MSSGAFLVKGKVWVMRENAQFFQAGPLKGGAGGKPGLIKARLAGTFSQ